MPRKIKAWENGRPIYERLPIQSGAFQGNAVVDAVTQPWDDVLMEVVDAIANIDRDFLDPSTARSGVLDEFTAPINGFTAKYWDVGWSEVAKRQLLIDAHVIIWANKGTLYLLGYLLDVFQIEGKIYLLGAFILSTNVLGDTLGGEYLEYWILMPLKYLDTSQEWALAERLNRLFMPCWCESGVEYDAFYLSYSRLGDHLW